MTHIEMPWLETRGDLKHNEVSSKNIDKELIAKYFEEITESIDLNSNSSKDEIEELKNIKPHAIITTNYDGALEKIFIDYAQKKGKMIFSEICKAFVEDGEHIFGIVDIGHLGIKDTDNI